MICLHCGEPLQIISSGAEDAIQTQQAFSDVHICKATNSVLWEIVRGRTLAHRVWTYNRLIELGHTDCYARSIVVHIIGRAKPKTRAMAERLLEARKAEVVK